MSRDAQIERLYRYQSSNRCGIRKMETAIIGVIINQYKRIVTNKSRKIHADFAWQSRFHDHIIRNNESHKKIRNYIANNPSRWDEDKFYN